MLKTEDGRTWATIAEAAKKLKVSPSRLVRVVKEGKVDALRLSAKAVLVDFQQAQFWRERFYSERKAQIAKKRRRKRRRTTQG